jgi:hypothetical protein
LFTTPQGNDDSNRDSNLLQYCNEMLY